MTHQDWQNDENSDSDDDIVASTIACFILNNQLEEIISEIIQATFERAPILKIDELELKRKSILSQLKGIPEFISDLQIKRGLGDHNSEDGVEI